MVGAMPLWAITCWTAQATDDEGAIAVSTAIIFTVVTNIPPAVAITSPVNGGWILQLRWTFLFQRMLGH
jgi:hypothetical protein